MKAYFDDKAPIGEACLVIEGENVTEEIALKFWMDQPDMPEPYKHMLIILRAEQD